ncbi:MAG: (Fe-S)-binding protein [Ferrovum sp.]|nr:(Fe-S)-binding protein [Ferrovum sp.]NDU87772.1 (Fe-S)-binding protein [Ferrovum sp.]
MRVGLWITCLVDLMRPAIGFSALKLLEDSGCTVVVPHLQTCCGQPGYNSGDLQSGKDLALKFLHECEDFDAVVVPSGSCGGMMRKHYPTLFQDNLELQSRFTALAGRVWELSEFLLQRPLPPLSTRFKGRLTYHDSCSGLRELGIRHGPRQLLQQIPGVELVEMADRDICCGFGGAFSVKLGDISTRMAENKCRSIRATGAHAVVGGDLGCLLTIEGRLRREGDDQTQVWHWAEILAGMASH